MYCFRPRTSQSRKGEDKEIKKQQKQVSVYIYGDQTDHKWKPRRKQCDERGAADGHGETEVSVCTWRKKGHISIHQEHERWKGNMRA